MLLELAVLGLSQLGHGRAKARTELDGRLAQNRHAGAEKFARTMSIATTLSGSVHGNGKQACKGEFT